MAAKIAPDEHDRGTPQEVATRRRRHQTPVPPGSRQPSQGEHARRSASCAQTTVQQSVFSPQLIVFALEPEEGGRTSLDLAATLTVCARWREALLSHSNDAADAIRSILSGHDSRGAPLRDPHLAFLPFASVGHVHADSRLLGMGLALPELLGPEERRAIGRVIARVRQLKLGRLGRWRVRAITGSIPPSHLCSESWTAHPAGATQWSSVTPIAFDRHPKGRTEAERHQALAAMIAESCERNGLPATRDVIITPVSLHLGVPLAHAFPRLERKDGGLRRHSHAVLVFDVPVQGPILLGAGRYRGYGLFRPMQGIDGPESSNAFEALGE
ncbi:MAG: type I-U CRISPR-associated protein Cas5/Cas6 [Gammaproteobacteria bacterium]|nr:type I-U CRISPR-associated protein Cas5/Cas6 [Gammaproteobacteria bacterium]